VADNKADNEDGGGGGITLLGRGSLVCVARHCIHPELAPSSSLVFCPWVVLEGYYYVDVNRE
jgi:hypothetical protein